MTQPHAFQAVKGHKQCGICGGWADHPDHSMELWTDIDRERERVRLLEAAESMSAEMRTPLDNINRATGILERESPLFRGTGDNPVLF